MKILLIFLFMSTSLVLPAWVDGQANDFIVIKKNGRTITSFFAGTLAEFSTDRGDFSGRINSISNDSIHLLQYDIRQMPTNLGVYVLDTVAIYHLSLNYHEITYVGRKARKGFNWAGSGGSLLGGGLLLTTIGLGTWIFAKPGTRYHASPALIIGSAVLGGVGYLLMKKGSGYKLGSKYTLEYIETK